MEKAAAIILGALCCHCLYMGCNLWTELLDFLDSHAFYVGIAFLVALPLILGKPFEDRIQKLL